MPELKKLPKTFRDRMSQEMLAALNELTKHEDKIMKALEDPSVAKIFAEDPAEALKAMRLPVNPMLIKKLKESKSKGLLNQFKPHFLPTGQLVKPNVRLKFVKGGK